MYILKVWSLLYTLMNIWPDMIPCDPIHWNLCQVETLTRLIPCEYPSKLTATFKQEIMWRYYSPVPSWLAVVSARYSSRCVCYFKSLLYLPHLKLGLRWIGKSVACWGWQPGYVLRCVVLWNHGDEATPNMPSRNKCWAILGWLVMERGWMQAKLAFMEFLWFAEAFT